MDYDADGRTDIVTGSYTGQLYLFRRLADNTFAQRGVFVDAGGKTLILPKELGYSIVPELVDMDADGDLDLVIGTRSAAAQVVINTGSRSAPVWSEGFRELKTTAGVPIEGSNAHHADWDGDGVRDLVLGSEHGTVAWHRNVGKNDAPRYGERQVLIKPQGSSRSAEGSIPQRHGGRVKVHVTDYNGDGRADLLVGDVTWQRDPPKTLTRKELKAKRKLENELNKKQLKFARMQPGKKRDALQQSIKEDTTKVFAYQRTKTYTHGFVWVYLRKGK